MLMVEWNWDDAINVWHKEGREKGREEEKFEIARKMKADSQPLEEISKYTGLALEVVEQL